MSLTKKKRLCLTLNTEKDMTKKEFFDIVKFHYMSVQNPTCIRWESEDGSVCEEIELQSYYNDGSYDYSERGKWTMHIDQRDEEGYIDFEYCESFPYAFKEKIAPFEELANDLWDDLNEDNWLENAFVVDRDYKRMLYLWYYDSYYGEWHKFKEYPVEKLSVAKRVITNRENKYGGRYRMTICDTYNGESVRYLGEVLDGCWGYEYNPAPYVGYMPCNA